MSVSKPIDHPSGQGAAATAQAAAAAFARRYGRPPRWLAAAPGRVNLIGEHTDYNDGFVLPMAIDRYTVIAANANSAGRVRIGSSLVDEEADIAADSLDPGGQPAWSCYVIGVLALCAEHGLRVGGIDAWVESAVPQGSGLSSSAALEVATATLAEAIAGRTMEPMNKARLCQRAEHEYAGVPCGIMDQATSVLGQAGHAILLDCRSGRVDPVAMDDESIAVLIANTNVRHALNDGEYAKRRAECEAAARAFGVSALRDVTPAMLGCAAGTMSDPVYRRARHVVGEIERTAHAATAMARRDWPTFGRMMLDSHDSLRDDFEVSCAELDAMVAIGRAIGRRGGVWGCRMTGGGFGGCTVWLVQTDRCDAIAERLKREYRQHTGIDATVFVTRPGCGAHVVDTNELATKNTVTQRTSHIQEASS